MSSVTDVQLGSKTKHILKLLKLRVDDKTKMQGHITYTERDEPTSEDVYGTTVNGTSLTEVSQRKENMFRLPRELQVGDKIKIIGKIGSTTKDLYIHLTNGDSNQVVLYYIDFDFNSKFIQVGKSKKEAKPLRYTTEMLNIVTGDDFSVTMRFNEDKPGDLEISYDEVMLTSVPILLKEVTHLILSDNFEVNELNYSFKK